MNIEELKNQRMILNQKRRASRQERKNNKNKNIVIKKSMGRKPPIKKTIEPVKKQVRKPVVKKQVRKQPVVKKPVRKQPVVKKKVRKQPVVKKQHPPHPEASKTSMSIRNVFSKKPRVPKQHTHTPNRPRKPDVKFIIENGVKIPVKKGVHLKENTVEHIYLKDVKTTCHYMKYLHNTLEPAVQKSNGDFFWYDHGVLHRENGPAVMHNNTIMWYNKGVVHREDGPAIIRKDGKEEFWVNGIQQQQL